WSSDVCSSDLGDCIARHRPRTRATAAAGRARTATATWGRLKLRCGRNLRSWSSSRCTSVLPGRLTDRRLRSLAITALAAAERRRGGVVPTGRRLRIAPFHDVLDLRLVDGLVLDQSLGHLVQ